MTGSLPFRPFIAKMTPYTPGEQPDDPRVIKLNTNESPFPPPESVLEEIAKASRKLRLYPNPTSLPLRRTLAAYHGVEPEQILVGNGSDEILRILIHAFVEKGVRVAIVEPTYSLYPVLVEMYEGETVKYPLENLTKLPEAFFHGDESLLILPNPNPPVGTLFGRDEVARLCRERPNCLVAIDEAYADFAPRDVVPLLSEFKNLAVTRTYSKSFSMAGMRMGYVVGSVELIAQLMKIKDSYNCDMLAQVAAASAIGAIALIQKNCAHIVATRKVLTDALIELGFKVPESHGNFVFAMHPMTDRIFTRLREERILVRRFDTPLLRDGMRISIGLPEEMKALIEALRKILKEEDAR
jgi:histidinol-phosphate aminotransferase